MSVIVSSSEIGEARFGYENLLENGTVTASSEASASGILTYDVENAYDWRLDDHWKPSSTGTSYITLQLSTADTASYFAVYAHDLADYSASVKLQYNTSSPQSWQDATSFVTPATNRAIYVSFSSILSADWRVVLSSPSGPASLGVVSFGEELQMPYTMRRGFEPPHLARNNEYLNSESETGAFIGRSLIRKNHQVSLRFDTLSPAFVRDSWLPFIKVAETRPFFFSWDTENHSDEAVFCWTEGDIPPPSYSDELYMMAQLNINARYD